MNWVWRFLVLICISLHPDNHITRIYFFKYAILTMWLLKVGFLIWYIVVVVFCSYSQLTKMSDRLLDVYITWTYFGILVIIALYNFGQGFGSVVIKYIQYSIYQFSLSIWYNPHTQKWDKSFSFPRSLFLHGNIKMNISKWPYDTKI